MHSHQCERRVPQKKYSGTYKRINIKGEKYDILHSHQCERRVPQKKIFGYFLGHLSFWVSGMELSLIFFIQKKRKKKKRKTKYIQIHD